MTAGVCQYCGVTDDQVDGDKLCWHDSNRDCCTRPSCVKQHHDKARIRAARPRSRFAELARMGWGRGAIVEQLRKEERARKRRKGKAA